MNKLIIFWPGFSVFNEPQIIFFQTLLNEFDAEIYFISDVCYGYTKKNNSEYYEKILINKRIHYLKFPHFRLRKLSIFQIIKMTIVILKILKKGKADAVLCSTQFPIHSKIAFVLSKLLKIKFFIYTEVWLFEKEKNIFLSIFHKVSHFIVRHSNGIFVQSKFKKNIYIGKGVSAEKIYVLPFLINDIFKGITFNAGIKRNKIKKFLFIGRLIPIKGVEILIKAFVKLIKKYKDIILYIGGDGKSMEYLKQLCRELNAINIEFLGWLNKKEKISLLKDAYCFIFPSIKIDHQVEGWGLALQEAISFGLPVITTDAVGSAYDFVKNGINGYIVKSNDVDALCEAMEKLYKMSNDEYLEASKTSRKIFEEYNSKEVFIKTLKEALQK